MTSSELQRIRNELAMVAISLERLDHAVPGTFLIIKAMASLSRAQELLIAARDNDPRTIEAKRLRSERAKKGHQRRGS